MKKYRVHFPQVNEMWIDVEASSEQAAIHKAIKERQLYYPEPDTLELPDGEQKAVSG